MLQARLIRASNASQPHRRREVLGVPEPSRYALATCLKMHSARRTEASVGREPQRALPDLKTSLFPEVEVGAAAKLEALRNLERAPLGRFRLRVHGSIDPPISRA